LVSTNSRAPSASRMFSRAAFSFWCPRICCAVGCRSALMQLVAGPQRLSAGAEVTRAFQCPQRSPAGRPVAALFIGQARQRFDDQRRDGGLAVSGQALDFAQQLYGQGEGEITALLPFLLHEKTV